MKTEVKTLAVAMGLQMFMRDTVNGTYAYLTDGKRIAYIQWGRSHMDTSVSSVHIPNRASGTGYVIDEKINERTVTLALDCVEPAWARRDERGSVRKWASWDAFHQSSAFNGELVEV